MSPPGRAQSQCGETPAPHHRAYGSRNRGGSIRLSRCRNIEGSPDDLFKIVHSFMSVFKAAGRDNALTDIADVGNSVTAAHGRRRGCVTTVDHL